MGEVGPLPIAFGRYELVQRLALGGMAEIFKARQTGAHGFSKTLVIKRILPHLAADPVFVDMFIDEAKLTVHLVHPKIVQVLEFGEEEAQYYIALEFVDGLDGLALLRMCAERRQKMPVPLAVWIVHEVLDALDFAHRATDESGQCFGIIHRDVSPSNIFIAKRGDVKLGDFGIARAAERQGKTQTGTLKGKYGYMSPEQVIGQGLDPRSDVFAVGIILAEFLTGRRLFTGPSELDVLLMVRDVKLDRLQKYGADLPPPLRAIIDRALQRDRQERYQSAAQMRDDLSDYLFSIGQRVSAADLGEFIASMGPTEAVESTAVDAVPQLIVEPAPEAHRAGASDAGAPRAVGRPPGLGLVESEASGGGAGGSRPGAGASRPGALVGEAREGAVVASAAPVLAAPPSASVAAAPRRSTTPQPAPRPLQSGVAAVAQPRAVGHATPRAVVDEAVDITPEASPSEMASMLEAELDAQRDSSESDDPLAFPPPPPLLEPGQRRSAARGVEAPSGVSTPVERLAEPPSGSPGAPPSATGSHGRSVPRPPPPRPTPPGGKPRPPSPPGKGSAGRAIPEDTALDRALSALGVDEPGPRREGGPPRPPADGPSPPTNDRVHSQPLPGRGAAPAARPLSSSGSIPLPLKASTSTAIRTKVPDEEGDLAAVSPTRVFCRLAAAAETGLLIVKCSAIRKEVFLVDGAPEFVSSNLASELLGEYLVSKGVISSGELSMALAMMPQFGNKLGNALVGLSLLRPLELFRLLTQQVRDKLIDVYTWTKGSYRYYRGERTTQEAFPLGLNIYEVTGAGVMAIPEPVLRARFESVLDSVPRIVPNPQLDPESFHISELLQQAVALLDNQRTIRELYEAGSTPEKQERFLRTLYLLVESELATLNRPW